MDESDDIDDKIADDMDSDESQQLDEEPKLGEEMEEEGEADEND